MHVRCLIDGQSGNLMNRHGWHTLSLNYVTRKLIEQELFMRSLCTFIQKFEIGSNLQGITLIVLSDIFLFVAHIIALLMHWSQQSDFFVLSVFLVKFLESPCLLQCKGLGKCSHYNDSVWAGDFRDWIPGGARFSILVQTGLGAHPASCAEGTSCLLG